MATETENGIEIETNETKTPNVIAPPCVSRLHSHIEHYVRRFIYFMSFVCSLCEHGNLNELRSVFDWALHFYEQRLPFPFQWQFYQSLPTSHNNPQPSTVSLFIVWLLDEHLAKTFYGPCVQFSVVILPAPSRTTLSMLDDYQSSRAFVESQVKCAFNLSLVFFLIFLLPELLTLYSRLTRRDFRFYLSVWNIIY